MTSKSKVHWIRLGWKEASRLIAQLSEDLHSHNSHGSNHFYVELDGKQIELAVILTESFDEALAKKGDEYRKEISSWVKDHTWVRKDKENSDNDTTK